MKVVLLGPTETAALRSSLGVVLEGAPAGTAQTPLAPLAAGLRALGHEVHLVTLDPSIVEAVTIREGGFAVTFCPLRGPPRYRARVRALDLFAREVSCLEAAIRAAGPDIVHAHWTYEYAEAAVRAGFPHLVTMHDMGWEYFWLFRDPYRFMRLVMKYRTMPRVRNLTVVAPFMAPKARQYGYFGAITAIPNGVELPRAVPDIAVGGRLAAPRIVTIGNQGRIKNVRKSVEAFRLIRECSPNAELHLFGPGLDETFVGAESGVVSHGNVLHRDLMRFLEKEATLLVHPSLLECCPMIVAEAKARAVPVVGGVRSGGVAFVCGDDAGCRLVDVTNPRSIADAALELLSSAATYRESAMRAHADVAARLSNSEVTRRYVAVYNQVLQ